MMISLRGSDPEKWCVRKLLLITIIFVLDSFLQGPVITDTGNMIVDWHFQNCFKSDGAPEWSKITDKLDSIDGRNFEARSMLFERYVGIFLTGVISHGLFVGMARSIVVGAEDGSVKHIEARNGK